MSAEHDAPGWATHPLIPGGRSLIEASAGTGKTWTIAVLYLRLLLEGDGCSPRQIVVTTFTDAAAQELRERIRARIVEADRWALEALAQRESAAGLRRAAPTIRSASSVDADKPRPDRAWADARWTDIDAIRRDRLRLQLALAELDEAPIGTLHALCRRILSDCPFESGGTLSLGEVVSGAQLQAELVDDAWRRIVQRDGTLRFVDHPWWLGGRGELQTYLGAALRPGVSVRRTAYRPIEELLTPELPEQIRDWLAKIPPARSNGRLKPALERFARLLESGHGPQHLTRNDIEALQSPLDKQVAAAARERAFAHPVATFLAGFGARITLAREAALAEYREQALADKRRRLDARDQISFDDLIVRVRDAIARDGARLADRLFADWPVALVDEFQDTDSLQYSILDRIYRSGDALRGRLVMIGDPKQAIYRFRGGDIDAYQRAAAQATDRLSLTINHRSADDYVRAVNELYALGGSTLSSNADHPIGYQKVAPSGRRADERYRIVGFDCQRPLALHVETDCPPAQAERIARALDACANQIADMLDSGAHTIGERALQPGDIAVLLPTHGDIASLRRRLQQRGVPCVSTGRSSVFRGDWARELQIVLHAVWHVRDSAAVRAALACRLGGCSYRELAALDDAPEAWQRHAHRFEHWHRLWQQAGVLAVVRALIDANASALLADDGGERALTDLRHLGELLQDASARLNGPEQLLAWLRRQREVGSDAEDAAEEQQLRIESDARRVTLMTLHASKGLEFPIVFLPLLWNHRQSPLLDRVVLAPDGHGGRVISFDDDDRAHYQQQGQDERFRVLYVALTRAIHACHVYAYPPDRPARANAKAADGDPVRSALDAMLARMLATAGDWTAIGTDCPHVEMSIGWRWPRSARVAVPHDATTERHVLPEPERPRYLQVHSFSTLTRVAPGLLDGGSAADESATDSAHAASIDPTPPAIPMPIAEPALVEHPQLLALAALKGIAFGNALHAIFEHRRIDRPLHEQTALIAHALDEAGVKPRELPLEHAVALIAERVQVCLDAELRPGLRIGALPAAAQRAEMAFHYVLDGVSVRALRHACERHGEPGLVPQIPLNSLNGLMTGKIDLLFEHAGQFHVLDYKGNFLGTRVTDYLPQPLATAMDHTHYRFQALLYTIALDRLLRSRVTGYSRATHLGSAWYLFVRAFGLAPDAGLWAHRFDDGLLSAVDDVLAARDVQAYA